MSVSPTGEHWDVAGFHALVDDLAARLDADTGTFRITGHDPCPMCVVPRCTEWAERRECGELLQMDPYMAFFDGAPPHHPILRVAWSCTEHGRTHGPGRIEETWTKPEFRRLVPLVTEHMSRDRALFDLPEGVEIIYEGWQKIAAVAAALAAGQSYVELAPPGDWLPIADVRTLGRKAGNMLGCHVRTTVAAVDGRPMRGDRPVDDPRWAVVTVEPRPPATPARRQPRRSKKKRTTSR